MLIERMNFFAKTYQFEQAQKIALILQRLDFVILNQTRFITSKKSTDYINYIIIKKILVIGIFCYRFQKLTVKKFKIHQILNQDTYLDVISSFLLQFYKQNLIPERFKVNQNLKLKSLALILKKRFLLPKEQEDKNILKLIKKEAKEEIFKFKYSANKTEFKELYLIKQLQEVANLKEIPFYFEVYDISNLKNNSQVGGVVVYKNGIEQPNLFRHYNINSDLKSDYQRFKFLIKKRFSKLTKITIPDLIIVDGGIIQINAVLKSLPPVLREKIEIIGLVKNKKHITDHIVDINHKKILISSPNLLFYLRNIQEKVHNFSIAFHRLKQKKHMYE